MAQMTEGQQKAARIATTQDALDLSAMSLIAVTGIPGAHRAILRHRSGRIETVTLGARTASGTVTEIDKNSLTLRRRGKPLQLALPA